MNNNQYNNTCSENRAILRINQSTAKIIMILCRGNIYKKEKVVWVVQHTRQLCILSSIQLLLNHSKLIPTVDKKH